MAWVVLRVRYHAHDGHVRMTDRTGGTVRTGRSHPGRVADDVARVAEALIYKNTTRKRGMTNGHGIFIRGVIE